MSEFRLFVRAHIANKIKTFILFLPNISKSKIVEIGGEIDLRPSSMAD